MSDRSLMIRSSEALNLHLSSGGVGDSLGGGVAHDVTRRIDSLLLHDGGRGG